MCFPIQKPSSFLSRRASSPSLARLLPIHLGLGWMLPLLRNLPGHASLWSPPAFTVLSLFHCSCARLCPGRGLCPPGLAVGSQCAEEQVSLWRQSPTGALGGEWTERGPAHSAGDSQQGHLIREAQKFGLVWFCWEATASREDERFCVAGARGEERGKAEAGVAR